MKKRLFSGIQPSGLTHLGNYFGAIKNWVKLQEGYQSMFCVVNYHAQTAEYDPQKMSKKIIDLAIDWIACGINPKKSLLFVQSDVPQVTELAWILNTITPVGELKRMTQFKDKSKRNPENINTGLFTYPILMAADILLYQSEVVPVGEDQLQHIELARTIVRKFNQKFGKTFVEPKANLTQFPRIMSLTDPKSKMSKSGGENSYIALSDSPKLIWEKLAKAMTDPARQRKTDPGSPQKCNLYDLHQLVTSVKQLKEIQQGCKNATIGCLDCKKILYQNLMKELAPIQKKRKELIKNPDKIKKILANGAKQAKIIAQKNLQEIRKKTGLG